MRITKILTAALIVLSAMNWLTACRKGSSNEIKTANSSTIETANNSTRTEAKNAAEDNRSETAKRPEILISPTASPTEIYKIAYAARRKKDIETEKKLMSKDVLEFLALMGETENKSVDDLLREQAETPQASTDETRNERINGGQATLEYPNADGKWKTMDFVKENGVWKITIARGEPTIETFSSEKKSNRETVLKIIFKLPE